MTLNGYITIRRLHELAFGVHVAAWFDEAVELWQRAYGQDGDPPVLLLNDGGYAGWGKALATAGPPEIDGKITHYLITLYSNDQTQTPLARDHQFRRDLIAHELAHVYERHVGIKKRSHHSTHESPSWRAAITKATPYVLPDLAAVAADLGVSVEAIFGKSERRVRRNPTTKQVGRYRDADAIPVQMLARWPHVFRIDEGRAAFVRVVEAMAAYQQRCAVTADAEAA